MTITLPSKPKHGAPCNGCGQCCAKEICKAGEIAFPGAVAPCPGLVILDNRTFCQLVMTEIAHGLEPVLQSAQSL